MSSRLGVLLAILILFCPGVSTGNLEQYLKDNAGQDRAYDHELPLLPAYCRCRVSLDTDRYKHEGKKWSTIFKSKGERGRDWIHVHHYCSGLIALSRAQRGVGKRAHLLSRAALEFTYMFRHSSPKFILMPEIHLKMGIVQKMMGKDGEALKHFLAAINLKKDYADAYSHVIDFFKEHQDYKNAIQTAKAGLRYTPNSAELKRKLGELQGLSGAK